MTEVPRLPAQRPAGGPGARAVGPAAAAAGGARPRTVTTRGRPNRPLAGRTRRPVTPPGMPGPGPAQ